MQRITIDQRTHFQHFHTWLSTKRLNGYIHWRCTSGDCEATRVTALVDA